MTPPSRPDSDFPYWLVAVIGLGLWGFWQILISDLHAQILTTLLRGVQVTVFVTLVGFALAAAFAE